MNEQHTDNSLRARILEKIRSKGVAMRPKWHFVLYAALIMTGSVVFLLALLYLASFIIFASRQTGAWFAPGFGPRGWYLFLMSLPWLLIILAVLFIFILEALVKHFAFSYRRPLLYSLAGIVAVVLIGGFAVSRTVLHAQLADYAESHHMPVAGPLYRNIGRQRFTQIHRGSIAETTTTGFIMRTPHGESLIIIVAPQTRLPFGMDFTLEDEVVVIGDRNVDQVQAFGVRRIPPEALWLNHRMRHGCTSTRCPAIPPLK